MTLIPTGPILGLQFGQDQILSRTIINYCTVEQIKSWLWRLDLDLHGQDGDPDDEIKMARDTVKRLINGHCKTEFDYVRRLEWASGSGTSKLMTRYYPIVDLEYIRAYNIDYQMFFQYSGDEMIVKNRMGQIIFPPLYIISQPARAIGASLSGFSFFPGISNIQLVYTTGFLNDEIPGDFSEYAAQWTAGHLLRTAHLRITEGADSRVINGVQEKYGSFLSVGTQYIEEAKEKLMRYRRVEVW